MKRTLTFAVALAAGSLLLVAGPASAARKASTPTPVTVVMHDPGCHWFMVHGKYRKADTVEANRVKLVDQDEAALKVASRHGLKHIPVGKSIVVGRGNYVIMMVGQAPDDNYLRLTVR